LPTSPSPPSRLLSRPEKPDFDALRGRDDFQKLLADVEAKSGPKGKPKD
jgi:hypothetical protein